MTFNLSKETPKFNLTKDVPSQKFKVSINWGKKNIKSSHDLDVDLMAICKKNNVYDNFTKCYFNRPNVYDGALTLSRDDRSGGKGEELCVDFSKFKNDITDVLIFITFYSNRHDKNHVFNHLDDFNLSITDLTNKKIIATSKDIRLSGVTHEIIKFVKISNEWEVELLNKSLGNLDFITYSHNICNNIPFQRYDYFHVEPQIEQKGFLARLFGL